MSWFIFLIIWELTVFHLCILIFFYIYKIVFFSLYFLICELLLCIFFYMWNLRVVLICCLYVCCLSSLFLYFHGCVLLCTYVCNDLSYFLTVGLIQPRSSWVRCRKGELQDVPWKSFVAKDNIKTLIGILWKSREREIWRPVFKRDWGEIRLLRGNKRQITWTDLQVEEEENTTGKKKLRGRKQKVRRWQIIFYK